MKAALTPRARALRRSQTDAEAKLWLALRNRQLEGFKFRRQVPRGPYVVGFLCVEAGLVVEVDGGQHADELAEHDRRRTRLLDGEGLKVLRFWNNEVLGNTEGVLATIVRALRTRQERNAETPTPLGERVGARGPNA